MEIKIHWTERALSDLERIFEYHLLVAGLTIARKMATQIAERIEILKRHPRIGPVEEQLEYMPIEHRYLVIGNYKIIYWVEGKIIFYSNSFRLQTKSSKNEGKCSTQLQKKIIT